jgi:hypothetical protein
VRQSNCPVEEGEPLEFLCYCLEKAWRLRLWTHDPGSTSWVDAKLKAVWEGFPHLTPDPRQVEPGLWLFESTCLEHATEADPLIEVHLRWDGPLAEASVTLDGKETRLDNRVDADPDPQVGDLLRVATQEETLELALRWFIALGHLGCREPEELALWGKLTTTTAFIVVDTKAWVEANTPLPDVAEGDDHLAVFVAFVGWSNLMERATNSVAARYQPACLGTGWYAEEPSRILISVGRVTESSSECDNLDFR